MVQLGRLVQLLNVLDVGCIAEKFLLGVHGALSSLNVGMSVLSKLFEALAAYTGFASRTLECHTSSEVDERHPTRRIRTSECKDVVHHVLSDARESVAVSLSCLLFKFESLKLLNSHSLLRTRDVVEESLRLGLRDLTNHQEAGERFRFAAEGLRCAASKLSVEGGIGALYQGVLLEAPLAHRVSIFGTDDRSGFRHTDRAIASLTLFDRFGRISKIHWLWLFRRRRRWWRWQMVRHNDLRSSSSFPHGQFVGSRMSGVSIQQPTIPDGISGSQHHLHVDVAVVFDKRLGPRFYLWIRVRPEIIGYRVQFLPATSMMSRRIESRSDSSVGGIFSGGTDVYPTEHLLNAVGIEVLVQIRDSEFRVIGALSLIRTTGTNDGGTSRHG